MYAMCSENNTLNRLHHHTEIFNQCCGLLHANHSNILTFTRAFYISNPVRPCSHQKQNCGGKSPLHLLLPDCQSLGLHPQRPHPTSCALCVRGNVTIAHILQWKQFHEPRKDSFDSCRFIHEKSHETHLLCFFKKGLCLRLLRLHFVPYNPYHPYPNFGG